MRRREEGGGGEAPRTAGESESEKEREMLVVAAVSRAKEGEECWRRSASRVETRRKIQNENNKMNPMFWKEISHKINLE